MKKTDFVYSTSGEPHRIRTRKILKEHPEIRELIGKNPMTFWVIVGIVGFQIGMAALVAHQPWWVVLIAAYLLGAFADHALFVMIHECAHSLLFKGKVPNRLAGMLANIPLVFPSSVGFERYHIKHHSFQGVHELDADLPNKWEAKLINSSFIGKALWLLLYPFVQLLRIGRLKEIQPIDSWNLLNLAVQIVGVGAIWFFLGPYALIYIVASFFFSIGLHPLGARWIQEHYLVEDEIQETYSYYGPLNTVAFNVGYHNEHHDFPSIPWNKLPQIKARAGEHYNNLHFHKSWTGLFFRFLFDREISLFSRIVRKERAKVQLSDQSIPDKELIQAEV